jgi:hypothetical protein
VNAVTDDNQKNKNREDNKAERINNAINDAEIYRKKLN